MKKICHKYEVVHNVMIIYCENMGAINISKNLVRHSRTKHIYIHHHFIGELMESKQKTFEHINTKKQVVGHLHKGFGCSSI